MKLDLKHKAYKITSDGTVTEVAPANGKHFKLEELYQHTDCNCVEIHRANFDEDGVPLKGPGGATVWLDENGKYKANTQHNPLATTILFGKPSGRFGDIVVGTALVCPAKMSR
jgi:hypothetical protein